MKNNQEIKKLKFIFCLIILLSNASLYLLTSSSPTEQNNPDKPLFRENHITIKIKAELMVPLSPLVPVTLISDKVIIRNVFLIKEIEDSQNSLQENMTELRAYFIEVHKKEFHKIKSTKSFKVYPNDIQHKTSKRKRSQSYELNY